MSSLLSSPRLLIAPLSICILAPLIYIYLTPRLLRKLFHASASKDENLDSDAGMQTMHRFHGTKVSFIRNVPVAHASQPTLHISTLSHRLFAMSQTLSLCMLLFVVLDVIVFMDSTGGITGNGAAGGILDALDSSTSMRIYMWNAYRVIMLSFITLFAPITLCYTLTMKLWGKSRRHASSRTKRSIFKSFFIAIFSLALYILIVYIFIKMTNLLYWEEARIPPPDSPLLTTQQKTPEVMPSPGDLYIRGLHEDDIPVLDENRPLNFAATTEEPKAGHSLFGSMDSLFSSYIHSTNEYIMERIILFGFILVATLTGVSSSLLPMRFIVSLCFVRESDLMGAMEFDMLQQKMERTERMIDDRVKKLEKLQKEKASAREPQGMFSFFSRATSLLPITSNNCDTMIEQTVAEIEALESLHEDLFLDVQATKELQDQLVHRRTWSGKLTFLLGFIVSLWCCFRITLSVLNITWNRRRHLDRDPIVAQLLDLIAQKTGFDMVSLHDHATLGIIFLVMLLTMRGLLLKMHRLFRKIFRSLSTNLIIQAFSVLMPIYTLSLVMLWRIHLPKSNRAIISTAMESHHEQLFYAIFDRTLVAAASIGLFAGWIISKFGRVPGKSDRNDL